MREGMQDRHGGPVLGGVIAEATPGAGNVLRPRSVSTSRSRPT